jgi:hypothetical protein
MQSMCGKSGFCRPLPPPKAAISIGSRRESGENTASVIRSRTWPDADCGQAAETRSILLHIGFDGIYDLLHRLGEVAAAAFGDSPNLSAILTRSATERASIFRIA